MSQVWRISQQLFVVFHAGPSQRECTAHAPSSTVGSCITGCHAHGPLFLIVVRGRQQTTNTLWCNHFACGVRLQHNTGKHSVFGPMSAVAMTRRPDPCPPGYTRTVTRSITCLQWLYERAPPAPLPRLATSAAARAVPRSRPSRPAGSKANVVCVQPKGRQRTRQHCDCGQQQ